MKHTIVIDSFGFWKFASSPFEREEYKQYFKELDGLVLRDLDRYAEASRIHDIVAKHCDRNEAVGEVRMYFYERAASALVSVATHAAHIRYIQELGKHSPDKLMSALTADRALSFDLENISDTFLKFGVDELLAELAQRAHVAQTVHIPAYTQLILTAFRELESAEDRNDERCDKLSTMSRLASQALVKANVMVALYSSI
jgi:hypothetical protein